MNENDIISRTLRKLALGVGSPGDQGSDSAGGACPDDETFGAFLDGGLDEAAAGRFCDHVAACPQCHTALAALRETEGIDGPPVPARLVAAARALVSPPLGERTARFALKLLDRALEIVDLAGATVTGGLERAAQPVRSGDGGAGKGKNASGNGEDLSRKSAEILELTPDVPLVERVTVQKIEPSDVRISLQPDSGRIESADGRFRVDLYRGETLLQSWPLEKGPLTLEPVTTGRYSLLILEFARLGKGGPERIGAIDIDLQS